MSEISYKPLIEDMVWSFSRVETYDSCPHRWFLKYIKERDDVDKFYATYGSFMHKLIEQYYTGELMREDMVSKFLTEFSNEVRGFRPKSSTVKKYIECGVEYLKNFKPFPFEMIAVEKEVKFSVNGIPFIGYIDFLGSRDGEIYIVDNKSRDLKPRSTREKPNTKDKELDEMLKQLYLYSAAVKQEYGKYPAGLCFNCFKYGVFIEEPFRMEEYEKTIEWVTQKIHSIEDTEDFEPKPDYFNCFYLCGVSDHCYRKDEVFGAYKRN